MALRRTATPRSAVKICASCHDHTLIPVGPALELVNSMRWRGHAVGRDHGASRWLACPIALGLGGSAFAIAEESRNARGAD